jgi:hypothetical protein
MYGKTFAQMYHGSMLGAGLEVFGVWNYMLANCDAKGRVEMNPFLVAVLLGCSTEGVQRGLDYLASPDPKSRTKDHEGRRIEREGEYLYHIFNHEKYRGIRDEADRREYQRQWVKGKRASRSIDAPVDCRQASTMSTHTEGEVEEEEIPPCGEPAARGGDSSVAGPNLGIAMFCEAWKTAHGTNPTAEVLAPAKRPLSKIFAQHGASIFRAALNEYFSTKDQYVLKDRHNPQFFARHFDRFSVTA